jgi:hypothetical protein
MIRFNYARMPLYLEVPAGMSMQLYGTSRELVPHPKDMIEARIKKIRFECTSTAGRQRLKHEPDKDGCCIFCDRQVSE